MSSSLHSAYTKQQLLTALQDPLSIDIKEQSKLIRDPLPKVTMHTSFLGSTMSGKSFLIKYLLASEYNHVFDSIYVFAPTADKEKYDIFDIPPENIITKFNEKDLLALFERIKTEFLASNGTIHTLFIFDDCTDRLRKFKQFPDFLSTCRHYSITVWLAEQYVKYSTPAIRNQMLGFFIFPNISEENGRMVGSSSIGAKKLTEYLEAVRDENTLTNDKHGLFFWSKEFPTDYFYVSQQDDRIEFDHIK
jgi:hypothetical protein